MCRLRGVPDREIMRLSPRKVPDCALSAREGWRDNQDRTQLRPAAAHRAVRFFEHEQQAQANAQVHYSLAF